MQIGSLDISSLEVSALNPLPDRQRAASTSPELRWDRRKQGLCVRCGSQDHWVHHCSLLPYSRTASPSATPLPAPLLTRKQTAQRTGGVPPGDTDDEEEFD